MINKLEHYFEDLGIEKERKICFTPSPSTPSLPNAAEEHTSWNKRHTRCHGNALHTYFFNIPPTQKVLLITESSKPVLRLESRQ